MFVAAFAPEAGEKLADINARYPDVPLSAAQRTLTFPTGDGESGTEVFIDHASFHDAFCADVPAERARVMALTQRPIAVDAFASVVTGTPAWHSLPSWAIVAAARPRDPSRRRAGHGQACHAKVVELDASHAVAVSQPARVTGVILQAVQARTSA